MCKSIIFYLTIGAIAFGQESAEFKILNQQESEALEAEIREAEELFLNRGVAEAFKDAKFSVKRSRPHQIEFRKGELVDHFALPETHSFEDMAYSDDGRFLFVISEGPDPIRKFRVLKEAFLFELDLTTESKELYEVNTVTESLPVEVRQHSEIYPRRDEVYSVSKDGKKVLLEASFSFRVKSDPVTTFGSYCPMLIDLEATGEEARSGQMSLLTIGSVAKVLREFEENWDSFDKSAFEEDSLFLEHVEPQLYSASILRRLRERGIDVVQKTAFEWEIHHGDRRILFQPPKGEIPWGLLEKHFWDDPVFSRQGKHLFAIACEGDPEKGSNRIELWKIEIVDAMNESKTPFKVKRVLKSMKLQSEEYGDVELSDVYFVDNPGKLMVANCSFQRTVKGSNVSYGFSLPFLIDLEKQTALEVTADHFPVFPETAE